MKTTELISRLIAMVDLYGDLQVGIDDHDTGTAMSICDVFLKKREDSGALSDDSSLGEKFILIAP